MEPGTRFRAFPAGGQKSTPLFPRAIRLAQRGVKGALNGLSGGPDTEKFRHVRGGRKNADRVAPAGALRAAWWLSRGRIAAMAGTRAGGQGDPELVELVQVKPVQVGRAEFVPGDRAPVGLRGHAPYTI